MRTETDSLGPLQLPDDVFYGINSYRALLNFPISGTQIHPIMISSYLLLKKAAALANYKAETLKKEKTDAIVRAVDELLESHFEEHFIIDTIQAGAGT